MNSSRLPRLFYFVVAVIFLLIAGWLLLWMFSSASLGCVSCNCTYSLFAEHVRCRQPIIAQLLFVVAMLVGIIAAFLGFRRRKHDQETR